MTISRRIEALETARADAMQQHENYPVYTREMIEAMSDAELAAAEREICHRPLPPQTPQELEARKRELKRIESLPDEELFRLYKEFDRTLCAPACR